MVNFKNKSTEMLDGREGENTVMGFATLLLVGLEGVPPEGTSLSDMRKSYKLIDILQPMELEEEVVMDDADFKFAVSRIPKNWKVQHRDMVAFDDYILELS